MELGDLSSEFLLGGRAFLRLALSHFELTLGIAKLILGRLKFALSLRQFRLSRFELLLRLSQLISHCRQLLLRLIECSGSFRHLFGKRFALSLSRLYSRLVLL